MKTMGMAGIIGRIRRRSAHAARHFRRNEQGLALTEFALIFPVMIFLFIGLVEFGEAFSVNRKISNAASTISDLISQESMVTCPQLQDIASIATEVIKPYRTEPLTLRIVSIVADEDNLPRVAWSYPEGAYTVGENYDLPIEALTEANSSLIVTETSYSFTPSVGYFIGDITLNGIGYFRPRLTRSVQKASCV